MYYYIFLGMFFATKEEAEETKKERIKDGSCLKSDPIIKKKLW